MKHACYAFSLLALLVASCAPSPWVWNTIDSRVAVQTPTPLQTEGVDSYKADLKAKGVDVAALASVKNLAAHAADGSIYEVACFPAAANLVQLSRTQYYDQAINGLIKAYGARITERSTFSTPAGEGVELKYIVRVEGEKTAGYQRLLLIGKVGYVLSFTQPTTLDTTDLAGAEQRRRFFNSITVKP